MADNLSFINWGFAPSKEASGWVLVETGNSYWENMEMDEHYLPYIRCYSVEDYKERIVSLIYSEIWEYLHERGNLVDLIEIFENDGEHLIIIPIDITMFGRGYNLPIECDFWFPQLAQDGDYNTMTEIMLGQRPMLGVNRTGGWVSTGITKFVNSILELPLREDVGKQFNPRPREWGELQMKIIIDNIERESESRSIFSNRMFECKFDNEFQVNQVALYLERIRVLEDRR